MFQWKTYTWLLFFCNYVTFKTNWSKISEPSADDSDFKVTPLNFSIVTLTDIHTLKDISTFKSWFFPQFQRDLLIFFVELLIPMTSSYGFHDDQFKSVSRMRVFRTVFWIFAREDMTLWLYASIFYAPWEYATMIVCLHDFYASISYAPIILCLYVYFVSIHFWLHQ